jgi:hypothetical protein
MGELPIVERLNGWYFYAKYSLFNEEIAKDVGDASILITELVAALEPFAQEAELQDAVRSEHGLADSEQVDCCHATLSDMDRARSVLARICSKGGE